jgi:hypothetical protein
MELTRYRTEWRPRKPLQHIKKRTMLPAPRPDLFAAVVALGATYYTPNLTAWIGALLTRGAGVQQQTNRMSDDEP